MTLVYQIDLDVTRLMISTWNGSRTRQLILIATAGECAGLSISRLTSLEMFNVAVRLTLVTIFDRGKEAVLTATGSRQTDRSRDDHIQGLDEELMLSRQHPGLKRCWCVVVEHGQATLSNDRALVVLRIDKMNRHTRL